MAVLWIASAVVGLAEAPLDDVLAFVPLAFESGEIWSTDGSGIRAAAGFSAVAGESPLDEKTANLAWEARIVGPNPPPAQVLPFHRESPESTITARFLDRELEPTASHAALCFSHPLDLAQEWVRSGPTSILNCSDSPNDGRFVVSSPRSVVKRRAAGSVGLAPSQHDHPIAARALHRIGDPLSAALLLGRGICARFTLNPLLEAIRAIPDPTIVASLTAQPKAGPPLPDDPRSRRRLRRPRRKPAKGGSDGE